MLGGVEDYFPEVSNRNSIIKIAYTLTIHMGTVCEVGPDVGLHLRVRLDVASKLKRVILGVAFVPSAEVGHNDESSCH